jgi:hypothetical protein
MKKKIQKRQRFSNRTYPPKLCKKQDCNMEFVPTDGRQVYCSAQHRIDSNNDKRKVIDKIESDFQKKAKKNKQILIKIKESDNYIKSGVTNKTLLIYEGFEFPIYHKKQVDSETNREILICYDYGLILVDAKNNNYIIEKISNK